MNDFFLIAKIVSLYGKNGFVKIEPFSDFPERYFQLEEVFIDFWGDKKKLFVEDVNERGNFFTVKFKNFDDERDAGILLGRDIYVSENDVVELPEGSYFIHDLIGSEVFRGDINIGEITEVIQAPANDVISVKGDKGKEILIPFVLEFIDKFDPESKKLFLKKGIVYDDED